MDANNKIDDAAVYAALEQVYALDIDVVNCSFSLTLSKDTADREKQKKKQCYDSILKNYMKKESLFVVRQEIQAEVTRTRMTTTQQPVHIHCLYLHWMWDCRQLISRKYQKYRVQDRRWITLRWGLMYMYIQRMVRKKEQQAHPLHPLL